MTGLGVADKPIRLLVAVVALCAQSAVVPAARAGAQTPPAATPGSGGPVVGEIGPARGPVTGGMVVAVIGRGFEGATEVRFGGVPTARFEVLSGQHGAILDAVAPPHTVGAVPVTVTTPAGTSPAGPASTFTYVPAAGHWASLQADRRFGHTATLLGDGKVLIAGGCVTLDPSGACTVATATAELYDPASRSFSPTGSMTRARIGHHATVLPDGKVLVSGGCPALRCPQEPIDPSVLADLRSADLYDPMSGTWSSTGSTPFIQEVTTSTLLPAGPVSACGSNCGKVLVVGPAATADGRAAAPTDAELYDPRRGTWSPTGPTQFDRDHPVAVALNTGRVLVTGVVSGQGIGATPGELYDAATGTWSPTGNVEPVPNSGSPSTLLADGRVLVAGPAATGGSMLYDPAAHPDPANPSVKGGAWTKAPPTFGDGDATTTRLHDGKVLVTGGKAVGEVLSGTGGSPPNLSAIVELYDKTTGTWSFADTTAGGRRDFAVSTEGGPGGFTTTRLRDGTVLVVGGSVKVNASASVRGATLGPVAPPAYGPSAELYTPANVDKSGSSRRAAAGGLVAAAVLIVAVLAIATRRHRRPRAG
ncbi:MAG: IPT/TIG domain-containing protein [Actinomycetota bacterium]|nr:IPT/TIG domain-containing protein [Actinomycetota bacterium]